MAVVSDDVSAATFNSLLDETSIGLVAERLIVSLAATSGLLFGIGGSFPVAK
jgi:hypothetical protein